MDEPIKNPEDKVIINNRSLTDLFQRWRKPIRRWLLTKGNVPPLWIDDLAQEVFVRLLTYSDTIELENPGGYIFKVAANVANEFRGRSAIRRQHGPEELESLLEDSERGPEELLINDDQLRVIREAVSRLTPRQQAILQMHSFEGMTYKQIATATGVTYRLVLRELTKSYDGLRMMLNNTDITDVYLMEPARLKTVLNKKYSGSERPEVPNKSRDDGEE